MGSWFLGKKADSNSGVQPANALRVQTSVQGKAIAQGWGQNRTAGNLIWYGDFLAIAHQQSHAGGGKGGSPSGGGGKGQQGAVSYTYSAAVAIALASGPVAEVLRMWNSKAVGTSAGFGFTLFPGDLTQSPWGYLTTTHPDEALNYRGLAYIAQAGIDLGSSTELPNYSVEVRFGISNGVDGIPDADAAEVVIDFLTNPVTGIGWPANRLGDLTALSEWSRATGLLISPVLTDQTEASSILGDWMKGLNCSPRFSSGLLDVVPWADGPVTGNGVTYTPNVTPLYDLTEDDFLLNDDNQPIKVLRARRSDLLNSIKVEYLDRDNEYNPDVPEAKDEAAIQEYGLRSDLRTMHFFCLTDAALLSAHLQLLREQIPNTYTFRLPAKFILPDVEDILTLTRPKMGLVRQAVRITNIQEQADSSLKFTAEQFFGTAGAPRYGKQASAGSSVNTNVDPGLINDPIIFEPTDQLGSVNSPTGGGLQVWAAVSGIDLTRWGGCNVYASYDNQTFTYVDRVNGPARMGALTAPLPATTVNPTGPNIDATNVLAVDISESGATLLPGTAQDVLALNTACYVDGEIIAYRDAALTGTSLYNLSYLNRGVYGTEARMALSSHLAGAPFARLDNGILKVPYDQSRIGATLYLKFQSFNIWGGGLQDISTLAVYPYTLTGSALASPLPEVQNVRSVYKDGFQEVWWDDVVDFRTAIRYKIYKGADFAGAEQVGDNAHAPFNAFGNATYWIVPYCQPVPGLYVQSEGPQSITITGNMLVKNLVYASDQQAAGWPGVFSNGVGKDGVDPNAFIRLGGGGDILTDPNVLVNPDVLNFGGIVMSGTYEISPADYIYTKYVADCSVNCSWRGVGVPVGQNILTIDDILNTPDILGGGSTQYVTVKVQIATAQSVSSDFFEPTDFFDQADMFSSGIDWSPWQDYAPGVYRAMAIKLRLVLETVDNQTIPYDLAFSYEVSVPARIDHYPTFAVSVDGITITFMPDDAAIYAPFNGGPPVGGFTNQPLPLINFSATNAAGLTPVIDSLTLAAITYHWEDAAGTHVAVASNTVTAVGF